MSNDEYSGKPPKSAEQIRRILESVHTGNSPNLPGKYARGLTEDERRKLFTPPQRVKRRVRRPKVHVPAAARSPAYYRELLLRRGGLAGEIVGLILGLNFGVAVPIMIGSPPWFALMPITMSLIGWSVGALVSRAHVID